MYKIIRSTEAKTRTIADNKTATNYITKDISKNISFATTEATNYYEKEIANYNRIYFVLEGELTLQFEDQTVTLFKDDCCFVQKGTEYIMSGSFKAVIVNQPAYGTINETI